MRLMSGLGGVDSAAPAYAMWRMSRMVCASSALTEIFDGGSAGLYDRLRGSSEADAGAFVEEFDIFIGEFGSRGANEWDLIARVWELEPDTALAAIDRMRFADDDASPIAENAARERERGELAEKVRTALAGDAESLGAFEVGLSSAATFNRGRERSKTAIIRVIHEGRMAACELGRRLAERGAIDDPTDIFMSAYIDAYCGLLRGDVVEWEGARMQMLHPEGSAPSRPIDIPILIGALGPKGRAVADKYDGVFATTTLEGLDPGAFAWVAYLYWGTVLEAGEDVSSERVRAAAGPGGALAYHATYELYGRDAVPDIPGGKEWLAVVDERVEDERHLDVHFGHCIHLNDADRAAWATTGGALLPSTTITGTSDEIKSRVDDLGAKGVTEVVFQPCGPDIRRELETMYAAASG